MTDSQITLWFSAARPKTLPAAVAPVIIGTSMAYADGVMVILPALAALFGAVMIQIGTNLANDYYDFIKGADRADRIGPTRLTQAGLISPRSMKRAAFVVFGIAMLAGCYLVWRGGWPIVAVGLTSILFGVLYTGGPFPLGYHGLGELFVLVFFGPVAVAGAYYVQALNINFAPIMAGLAPGLISVAILVVNNLRDIDNDRAAGKRTLAVRLGRTFARWEYTLSVLFACLLPPVLVVWFDGRWFSMLACLTLAGCVPAIKTVWTTVDGHRLNNILAATGRLLLLYTILFSIGWVL
ncbi:MAG: 1,4-dihydroxy-2-naphthoate polyprenyltransferase [candidate division Zixibacteria bacterium]|nr:1,4-dihydroxy-2-naphthoate polyprenyltransferase [candidate division Zixibacteria bacterium]MDH3939316.1 1,4-dihydroxy-2-naphthoate polyprenyltransferase [candidate division Zixibacteria bacterium]MDH4034726.1 1,4-dihydroxy-2-naphthoate polyprenyltransferase [candidate division Zixibacteria bacterium]